MKIFLFWLIFILMWITGQVVTNQTSSITSTNLNPQIRTMYEWPCGDETCWWIVETGETGT